MSRSHSPARLKGTVYGDDEFPPSSYLLLTTHHLLTYLLAQGPQPLHVCLRLARGALSPSSLLLYRVCIRACIGSVLGSVKVCVGSVLGSVRVCKPQHMICVCTVCNLYMHSIALYMLMHTSYTCTTHALARHLHMHSSVHIIHIQVLALAVLLLTNKVKALGARR